MNVTMWSFPVQRGKRLRNVQNNAKGANRRPIQAQTPRGGPATPANVGSSESDRPRVTPGLAHCGSALQWADASFFPAVPGLRS